MTVIRTSAMAGALSQDAVDRATAIARLGAGPVEYRLERRAGPAVVVFHGGHMRAGLSLGEAVFADGGYTVLVASRPGYSGTPLRVGRSPEEFAEVVRELCSHLGIEHIAAAVGISAGGRWAIAMAALYPEFVHRLILQSAVGYLPWPGLSTRAASWIGFNAITGRATWSVVAALMRLAPGIGLRVMLRPLSTRPIGPVVAGFSPTERAVLVQLFSQMRSGRGFLNDLRAARDYSSAVGQPTLVVASRKDSSVPFAHAESLVAGIQAAELVVSDADTHFIWFGDDYKRIAKRMHRFLGTQ